MTVMMNIFIMVTLSSFSLMGSKSKTKKQNWGRISKKGDRQGKLSQWSQWWLRSRSYLYLSAKSQNWLVGGRCKPEMVKGIFCFSFSQHILNWKTNIFHNRVFGLFGGGNNFFRRHVGVNGVTNICKKKHFFNFSLN